MVQENNDERRQKLKENITQTHILDSKSIIIDWDLSLTEKLRYFLMLKPLIDLTSISFKDQELAEQCKHYDGLAIALKIIQLILDHTTIVLTKNINGITREEIINKIIPILKMMDDQKGVQLTEEKHRWYIDRILERLISPGREIHELDFTDYSKIPFERKRMAFRLLYYEPSPDDVNQLFVDTPLINIFANILDLKLEDQQQAILYILNQQIERGDLQNALKTAKKNIEYTIIYVKKVQDIIEQTKRKYQPLEWRKNYPKVLREVDNHLETCTKQQRRQQIELVRRYSGYSNDNPEQVRWLKELEDTINLSFNMIAPLLNKIQEVREVFLKEQAVQAFYKEESQSIALETDIFYKVLVFKQNQVDDLLNNILGCFGRCDNPRLDTMSQMIHLLLKNIEVEEKHVTIPKRQRDRTSVKKEISAKFPNEIREQLINRLLKILEPVQNASSNLKLSEILKIFQGEKSTPLEQNYIRLLIQGRYAISNFEGRFLKQEIEVEWMNEYFDTDLFTGRDMIVEIRKIPLQTPIS